MLFDERIDLGIVQAIVGLQHQWVTVKGRGWITQAPRRWTCGAMPCKERHRWPSRSPDWLSRKDDPL